MGRDASTRSRGSRNVVAYYVDATVSVVVNAREVFSLTLYEDGAYEVMVSAEEKVLAAAVLSIWLIIAFILYTGDIYMYTG